METKVLANNLRLTGKGALKRGKGKNRLPRNPRATLGADIDQAGEAALRIAQRAMGAVAKIGRYLNVEEKNQDVLNSVFVSSASPTVYPLSQIAQGIASNQRTGLTCKMSSWQMRYDILLDTASPGCFVRVVLLYDKQNAGATPGAGSILQDSTNLLSPINVVSTNRYEIIYDKTHAMSLNGVERIFDSYAIGSNRHLDFSGANATDTIDTHCYLLLMSNVNANLPAFNWWNRITFVDN